MKTFKVILNITQRGNKILSISKMEGGISHFDHLTTLIITSEEWRKITKILAPGHKAQMEIIEEETNNAPY